MSYNIAIDGPAGAGKSTIARRVSKELAFIYVDTGALYRALALYCIEEQIEVNDERKLSSACERIQISIQYLGGEQQVILNGQNVNHRIRTEEVGNMASVISGNPAVRLQLLELQRTIARENNVVMDGRDIGTFVLPQADLKIFLTASVKTRALRRFEQLRGKGIEGSLADIEEDIESRDKRDMSREISPLRQAEDAVLLDSSQMTIDEVVHFIIKLYNSGKNKQ
jgi:cytidylate kinase